MEKRGFGNNNFNSQMFGNNQNQLTQEDIENMTPEEREELYNIMGKMTNFTNPNDMEEWNRDMFQFFGEYYQNQLKNGSKKSPNSNSNINSSESNGNSNSNSSTIAIIAGIAVVIVIAVIGAAVSIVKRNKRKQEEKYKNLSRNTVQPQQSNPIPIIIQQQPIYTTTSDNPPNYQPPAYSIEDGDAASNLGEGANTNSYVNTNTNSYVNENTNSNINASASVYSNTNASVHSNTNENSNTNTTVNMTNASVTQPNQRNIEIPSSSSSQTKVSPVLSKEQLIQYVTTQQVTKSIMQPVQPLQPVVQPMMPSIPPQPQPQPLVVKKSVNEPLPKTMMVGNQLYVLADPNYRTTTPPSVSGQVMPSYSPSLAEKRPLYPPNYSYTATESAVSSKKLEAYSSSSSIQVPIDATPMMVPHLTAVRASPVHGPVRVALTPPITHPLTPPLAAAAPGSVQPRPVYGSVVHPPASTSAHSTVSISNRNSQVRDRKN